MKRTLRSVGALALCALLSTGPLSRVARADDATPPSNTSSANGTTPTKQTTPEATALTDGGFALDFEIWQPAGHGAAKSLTVTYTWGKAGTRTAVAQRRDDRWHVEFPDEPQANEQASLKLHYAFALSPDDQQALKKAARNVAQAVLNATVTASKLLHPPASSSAPSSGAASDSTAATTTTGGTAGSTTTTPPSDAGAGSASSPPADTTSPPVTFATAFDAALKPIGTSTDATTLHRYGTSAGEDGFTVVLGQLGVVASPDGSYSLIAGGKLQAAASSFRISTPDKDVASRQQDLAQATPDATNEKPCVDAVGAAPLTSAQALNVLKVCAATLNAVAAKLPTPLDKKYDKLKELKDEAAKAAPALDDIGFYATTLDHDPRLKASYSLLAVRLATLTAASAHTVQGQSAMVDTIVNGLDTTFEDGSRLEDGATLVEANTQPRRYDIATGAVFVSGLQDIVVPALISICPAEGCLTTKDVAWRAKHGWWRALSFDAGVRTKTLDTQDRRQSDKLSFLTGMSYNPVSVLRVSGGFYWFENAQTSNWAGQLYVGVTLNVLNAAQILGGLGLGDKLGPATQPIQ